MTQSIDVTYLTFARWVMEYGWIEIGHDDMSQSFVRALDEGGLVWEGQEDYAMLIGKYLSRLRKLDDVITPKEGFET